MPPTLSLWQAERRRIDNRLGEMLEHKNLMEDVQDNLRRKRQEREKLMHEKQLKVHTCKTIVCRHLKGRGSMHASMCFYVLKGRGSCVDVLKGRGSMHASMCLVYIGLGAAAGAQEGAQGSAQRNDAAAHAAGAAAAR